MIMCIFLYQLLTSNKALSVILSCCYLVLAANRNKATGGESKVESLGGNRLIAVRYVVQLLLLTYDGFCYCFHVKYIVLTAFQKKEKKIETLSYMSVV